MADHRFHLVNVFTDTRLAGNALCVFEDGRGLSDSQMQALALQFNLSETTFLLPSSVATAKLRIFAPTFEMPFAGHPTLGSAHVLRARRATGDDLTLEMKAGTIAVHARDDVWTLQAGSSVQRAVDMTRGDIATMLGLAESDVADHATWMNTGSEQLMVPLTSPSAVDRCRPDAHLMARHTATGQRSGLAYVWSHRSGAEIVARFFFLKHGSLVEDPGTGSACANLGGWFIWQRAALPLTLTVRQGEATGRPCKLVLHVSRDEQIFVSGQVVYLGTGVVTL